MVCRGIGLPFASAFLFISRVLRRAAGVCGAVGKRGGAVYRHPPRGPSAAEAQPCNRRACDVQSCG